jgi:hypothetical protein
LIPQSYRISHHTTGKGSHDTNHLGSVFILSAVSFARSRRLPHLSNCSGIRTGSPSSYDGQLLTRYLIKSGNKPILWPIIGPNGEELTRGYPMREATPDERPGSHPHQRSLWFTHGDVNGISFWHEGARSGEIVHREFVKVEGGDESGDRNSQRLERPRTANGCCARTSGLSRSAPTDAEPCGSIWIITDHGQRRSGDLRRHEGRQRR